MSTENLTTISSSGEPRSFLREGEPGREKEGLSPKGSERRRSERGPSEKKLEGCLSSRTSRAQGSHENSRERSAKTTRKEGGDRLEEPIGNVERGFAHSQPYCATPREKRTGEKARCRGRIPRKW